MPQFEQTLTGTDYDSLIDRADTLFTEYLPEWKNRDDNDINWITVKSICRLLEMGYAYIDLAFNEQDPYTVSHYNNAVRLARAEGMDVKKYIGATTQLKLSLAEAKDLVVPRGTKFSTSLGLEYVLLEDVTFEIDGDLDLYGDVQYGSFDRIDLTIFYDGSNNQMIRIPDDNIQSGMVRVFVDGVEWQKVDSLVLYSSLEEVFKLVQGDDGIYYVQFGDGIAGKKPIGSTIEAEIILMPVGYLADKYGNIPAGNITISEVSDLTVLQESAATGGFRAETAKEIGRSLVAWKSANHRLVSLRDAVYLARRVPGVSGASAKIREFDYLVTVTSYNGVPSLTLLDRVTDYLSRRKVENMQVSVLMATPIELKVGFRLIVTSNYDFTTVSSEIKSAVSTYVSDAPLMDYITPRDIYNATALIRGIAKLTLTTLYEKGKTPRLGDVQIEVGKVPTCAEEDITITEEVI